MQIYDVIIIFYFSSLSSPTLLSLPRSLPRHVTLFWSRFFDSPRCFSPRLFVGVSLRFTTCPWSEPRWMARPRGMVELPQPHSLSSCHSLTHIQPWITPSLFDNTGNNDIVDEWTFCQYQDVVTATAALRAHWDTWITENDFANIAAAGYIYVLCFRYFPSPHSFEASIMCACQSVIGLSMLDQENLTSRASFHT